MGLVAPDVTKNAMECALLASESGCCLCQVSWPSGILGCQIGLLGILNIYREKHVCSDRYCFLGSHFSALREMVLFDCLMVLRHFVPVGSCVLHLSPRTGVGKE